MRDGAPYGTFQEHSAIARFGVGRNMAVSMRYWGLATAFLEEKERVIRPTKLGNAILADNGYDPFLERAATVWLAHWGVASTPEWTTTAYFAFNVLSAIEFDTSNLIDELLDLVKIKGGKPLRTHSKETLRFFSVAMCDEAEWLVTMPLNPCWQN